MQQNTEYVSMGKNESYGVDGYFGIEVLVAATNLPDLRQENIRKAYFRSIDSLSAEIQAAIKQCSHNTPKETEKNRELLNIFEDPIFIEEIQNGYCKSWCCRHLPWFVVTTKVGRIKIGWGKRVIMIDWSETRDTEPSVILFPDEDVTKGDKYIHAWSIEDAKRYVRKIVRGIIN